jgi:hypothetical protein
MQLDFNVEMLSRWFADSLAPPWLLERMHNSPTDSKKSQYSIRNAKGGNKKVRPDYLCKRPAKNSKSV